MYCILNFVFVLITQSYSYTLVFFLNCLAMFHTKYLIAFIYGLTKHFIIYFILYCLFRKLLIIFF